jgi:tetratricopeptide (TPR) repeat protein
MAATICDSAGASADDRRHQTLDGLASLLDKSLLQQQESTSAEPHFMMLETIREYALEELIASGELGALQQRHAAFFLALAEAAPHELAGVHPQLWFDRLDQELPNLRAALVWSRTETDSTTGLRLMVALDPFWSQRSYMSEQRRWLTEVLNVRADHTVWPATAAHRSLRAQALEQLGNRAAWQSDLPAAQIALEESLALYRELEDTQRTAAVLAEIGMTLLLGGDYQQSAARLEEGLRLVHQIGDNSGLAFNCFFSGALAYAQGNLTAAEECWDAGLTIFRQRRDPWMIATSLVHLGIVALDRGDDRRAEPYLTESLKLLQELGERWQTTLVLEVCAGLVATRGCHSSDPERVGRRASQIFGAAETLREMLGAPRLLLYRDHCERGVAAARTLLNQALFDAAWAAGRRLSLEQVVAEALNAIVLVPTDEHVDF